MFESRNQSGPVEYGRSSWERTAVVESGWVAQFVSRTYAWMVMGLGVTAAVSAALLSSERLLGFFLSRSPLFLGLLLFQLGLVMSLSAFAQRISPLLLRVGFFTYAALNGIVLTPLSLIYTGESIAQVFLLAAGMFGALALYGSVTRRDLTPVGSFFAMGLLGLIGISVINLFVQSSALSLGLSLAGVLIFAGLTAYDAQRIRALALLYAQQSGSRMEQEEEAARGSLFAALGLYLNFINLFLHLLKLLGNRRRS
jgi:FtsH-binding integral membrane protein